MPGKKYKSYLPNTWMVLITGILFCLLWGHCDNNDEPGSDTNDPGVDRMTIYVDDDGSDLNFGLTPDKPLKTITKAIKRISGSGVTVKVAPGVYDNSNGERFPLILKDDMKLIGAGLHDNESQRSIIDARGVHQRIIFFKGEEKNIVISGFEFRNGNITGQSGGAILVRQHATDITISDNLFTDNIAVGGGAMVIGDSENIVLENNIFRGNRSYDSDAGALFVADCSPLIRNNRFEKNVGFVGGGGIQVLDNPDPFDDTKPLIENNVFIENEAQYGGAVYVFQASPRIIGNRFEKNVGVDFAGAYCAWGIFSRTYLEDNVFIGNSTTVAGGGAAITWGAIATFFHNVFQGNHADQFGGAYTAMLDGRALLRNCLFYENTADLYGGALCVFGTQTSMDSCTVARNGNPSETAVFGPTPGVASVHKGSVTITNSIIWETSGRSLFTEGEPYYSTITMSYSNSRDTYGGTQNLSDDPLFVQGPGGPFYLAQGTDTGSKSPCIDKGNTAADAAGLQNGWTTAPDQTPDAGTLDLGYHYPIQ